MLFRTLLATSLLAAILFAQQAPAPWPPEMKGASVETYKTIGDTSLKLYIYRPEGKQDVRSPAIVFFFGGGWTGGTPGQFEQQCRYLASRGMVAIAADYRVKSRNQSTVTDAVRDAKSAIRYVRQNAARLGVDPARIAAAGGSAGGHLAASAGIITGLDEPAEDPKISSRPDALVLFNPVVILAPVPGDEALTKGSGAIAARGQQEPPAAAVSPWHHVATGQPPTIIFHGKADTTVPYLTVESFTRQMKAAGNRCELVGFEGENHGFFNFRPAGNKYYDATLQATDKFLVSLGFLK